MNYLKGIIFFCLYLIEKKYFYFLMLNIKI